MLALEKKITFDEYMQMPIGAPYQYINGCLIDWPSRTPAHQIALGEVSLAMMNYQDETQNEGIFIIGPIEVILDDQNSFQPDFVYVAAENKQIVKDYIYGAPDLVIEVLWEKNAYYDLQPKKDTYEKYGVKEYIIIDPIAKNADLYILKNGQFYTDQKAQTQYLHSNILPGLILDLDKIFRKW